MGFMGGCMERKKEEIRRPSAAGGDHGADGAAGKQEKGVKVKIVLTRRELDQLMLQLKGNGERKLEDVLVEMTTRELRRQKSKSKCWRPKLESIVENNIHEAHQKLDMAA